uniref:CCHC-type domain-containing protein n=1 Tax=Ficedula albicollis TaxID=59894 RepID=A0A803V0P5_FICAL
MIARAIRRARKPRGSGQRQPVPGGGVAGGRAAPPPEGMFQHRNPSSCRGNGNNNNNHRARPSEPALQRHLEQQQQPQSTPLRACATAPSGVETRTLPDFYPIKFKKQTDTGRKTLQAPEEEQGNTLFITASEGIPASAASIGERQRRVFVIPEEILDAFIQQKETVFEPHPLKRVELSQIPQMISELKRSIPQPEQRTIQQVIQLPTTSTAPMSQGMDEAAAWPQLQQLIPLPKQTSIEEEASTRPEAVVDWSNIRMELARSRECPAIGTGEMAMPVNYDQYGQNPRWHRINHELVKDLIKAIRDYGLGSSYFKQLLKGIFNEYDLTPFDVRSLALLMLTDTQVLIWESKWRRALQELQNKYQRGPHANFTIAELAGDPPHNNPAQQAARLPREVLTDVKEAARRVILQISPAGAHDVIYTEIKQGPSEPFSSFVDKLTQAIDRQITEESARPYLLKTLAFANANPECKRIIAALPGDPSLTEMIEACNKVGTIQHLASIIKEQVAEVIQEQKVFASQKKSRSEERGQAARLPREVLTDVKEAARRAILQISPAGAHDVIYTEIKQGPSEPFSSFVDKLTQAIDRQITEESARPYLLKTLAFANANPECRRIIAALPGDPSLTEMIEACSKVGTIQHLASVVKEQVAEIFQEQRAFASQKKITPSEEQCYKCGEIGHFKRDCPHSKKTSKPSQLCPRCRRGRHLASECYSSTDVDGRPLPVPKNSKKSATPQRAMTEVMVANLGAPQAQTLQPSGNVNLTPSAGH